MKEGHVLVGELVETLIRVDAAITLRDAAAILAETGCDRLLVGTSPPSELSESDVVRSVARGLAPGAPAAEAASDSVLVIEQSAPADSALQLMVHHNRRSLIVIDDQDVAVGLLRLGTAFAALLQGPTWLGALRVALRIDEVVP